MKEKNSDNQLIMPLNEVEIPLSNVNNRKPMINVRGAFSESIGVCSCVMEMQFEDFDERTRMQISNQLYKILEYFFEDTGDFNDSIQYQNSYANNTGAEDFSAYIVADVFNQKVGLDKGYSYNWRAIFDNMHKVLMNAPYNEVLNLIWISCKWIVANYHSYSFQVKEFVYDMMNELFEKEYVGYRYVAGKITQITDKNEIIEIESACKNPFAGCRSHIQKAVDFLADREHKDYKNCIKESICAVESICKVIVEDENADLAKAIKKLKENGLQLHSALELAFIKLYAYTSDKGGIRHSEGMFESNVTFEEAKYMLVSCSAFVIYLVAEYGKLGGKNDRAANER